MCRTSVFRRKTRIRYTNHKTPGSKSRAHADRGVFHRQAHRWVNLQSLSSSLINIGIRFAPANTYIFMAGAAHRNQSSEPGSRQRTADLIARRRRCHGDRQLLVHSPLQEFENAGQRLYAGAMEDAQILLGARTEQVIDGGGQIEHALQVLPKRDFSGADIGLERFFTERFAVAPEHHHGTVVVKTFGVDQRAVKIEQYARQRLRGSAERSSHSSWWRRLTSCRALIVVALAACSNPAMVVEGSAEQADAIQVVLPARYAHWQPFLEQELCHMQQAYPVFAARWPRVAAAAARRMVVPVDQAAAATFYLEAGLYGDPSTPRTFPSLALAVVPLPRDDSLLAELSAPPRTWLHSFRHEAAHLLSEEYPDLRAAPLWFQEGLAELWCEGAPPAAPLGLEAWPYWRSVAMRWGPGAEGEDAPAEIRYSAFALRCADTLYYGKGLTPWLEAFAQAWTLPANALFLQPFLGLRGRDADWDLTAQHFLLVSRPGQQVDLDLPWSLVENSTTRLELQHGRAPSDPEAGLILSTFGSDPANSAHVRIRLGQNGGWAAYPEAPSDIRFEALSPAPLPRQPGLPHQVEFQIDHTYLVMQADGFQRRWNLSEINLKLPLQLRMYVRDGALALRYR